MTLGGTALQYCSRIPAPKECPTKWHFSQRKKSKTILISSRRTEESWGNWSVAFTDSALSLSYPFRQILATVKRFSAIRSMSLSKTVGPKYPCKHKTLTDPLPCSLCTDIYWVGGLDPSISILFSRRHSRCQNRLHSLEHLHRAKHEILTTRRSLHVLEEVTLCQSVNFSGWCKLRRKLISSLLYLLVVIVNIVTGTNFQETHATCHTRLDYVFVSIFRSALRHRMH